MISYTTSAFDEDRELDKLLFTLSKHIKDGDEVIVQLDADKATDSVRKVCSIYQEKIPFLKVIEFPLNNDFASFKNNLLSHCSKEWIFNIDADEIPASNLFDVIHTLLSENSTVEMFWVPRWNTVENITEEHIANWRWRYDEWGRINWPDWQTRIYKNKETIRWQNKVHERLTGYETYGFLPEEKDWCLFHNKTINRQEQQNNYYNTIGQ
jgi:glycosyltransferase involved in cell wall biosynthesis